MRYSAALFPRVKTGSHRRRLASQPGIVDHQMLGQPGHAGSV